MNCITTIYETENEDYLTKIDNKKYIENLQNFSKLDDFLNDKLEFFHRRRLESNIIS